MDLKQSLIHFGSRWDEAFVSNDPEKISEFMSDDWTIIGTEGGITSKKSFMQSITSGDVIHTRMDSDKTVVNIYENTGIVTSRGTSAGYFKGQPFELYEWSTSVFIRSNDSWSCVVTMLTPARHTSVQND